MENTTNVAPIPDDYRLTENFVFDCVLASILICVFLVFSLRVLCEIKSTIYNIFSFFVVHFCAWIRVRIGNLEGYMEARYLLLNAGINSVASAMPTVTIRNSSGTGLNLRENPSKNSTILGLYSNGTSVQVLGLSENWYHVQVDGKTGFMISSGFSDRLSYSSSNTGNSSNNTGNSSKENTVWNGPSGTHKTAEWPLIIDDYLAVVNNPKSTDRLHLRSSASEKATSLGKYYNGVRVIVDGPVDGEWTKVIVGNLNGYMKTEYLVISGEGKPYPASAMPIMTINNPNSEQCVGLA